MRLRPLSFFLLGSALFGCGAEPAPSPLAFRDPLGLMDVTQDLRLVVFPASERSCNSDGSLSPALPATPDEALPSATVDRRFPATELEQRVTVDAGSYVVAVQGWGTDPVTMVTNTLVTQGCATGEILASQEQPLTLTLQDIEGSGVCMDGVLSPDEQCEASTGPFPCDETTCRTTEAIANTERDSTRDQPAADWRTGGRLLVAFQKSTTEQGLAFLSETAQPITSPAALAVDGEVGILAGVQTAVDIAGSPARVAVVSQHFNNMADVSIRFFSTDRSPLGGFTRIEPQDGAPGAQTRPRIAMATDGATMIVFDDGGSSSGATAAFVAAGATSAQSTFALGTSGATTPSIATNGNQFLVTWVEGGAVQGQRYGTDGTAVDTEPFVVSDSASAGNPEPSLLADGRAYVVWSVGSGVRGRAIDASGTAGQANDLTGTGQGPHVASGSGRFLVVWEASGSVMARYVDGNGVLVDNHEVPRTTGAFTVGAGTGPVVAGGGTASQAAAAVVWESGGNVAYRTLPLP